MKQLMYRLLLGFIATLASMGLVPAQDTKAPENPPVIAVIKRFLGEWDVTMTNRVAAGETTLYKAVSRRTWDGIGQSVRFDDEQPNGRPPLQMSLRHDPEVGSYPMSVEAGGTSFQLVGSWNDATATMEFIGGLPKGPELSLEHRFVAPDKAVVTATVRSPEGKELAKLEFHQTRRVAGD